MLHSTRPLRTFLLTTSAMLAACPVSADIFSGRIGSGAYQRIKVDRLEVSGAPDDGLVQFRASPALPLRFLFGQVVVGYARRPLRVSHLDWLNPQVEAATYDTGRGQRLDPLENQLTLYLNFGAYVFDRLLLGVSLPFTPFQNGDAPRSPDSQAPAFFVDGTTLGDLRLDTRLTLLRSADRSRALAVQGNFFFPTGRGTWGGDFPVGSAVVLFAGEVRVRAITFLANLGFHRRALAVVAGADPTDQLILGDNLRGSLGAYWASPNGAWRFGVSVVAETGFEWTTDSTNFLAHVSTPVEWNGEVRRYVGNAPRAWFSVATGTRLSGGYGAPDVRALLSLGVELRFLDGTASAPLSAPQPSCPTMYRDPEEPFECVRRQHAGPPTSNEPPQQAPEGVPVPRDSEQLQRLHDVRFAFASSTILPESEPTLNELAEFLRRSPRIKLVEVAGHTDDQGSAGLNEVLSAARARAVVDWLVTHGVSASRLRSRGYGYAIPQTDNATESGRARNRRVEFHVIEEE